MISRKSSTLNNKTFEQHVNQHRYNRPQLPADLGPETRQTHHQARDVLTIFGAAVYMLLSDVSRSFVSCHDYCNASECLCILLIDVCFRIFHSSIFHPSRQLMRRRLETIKWCSFCIADENSALTSTTKEAKALQQRIHRSEFRRRKKPRRWMFTSWFDAAKFTVR